MGSIEFNQGLFFGNKQINSLTPFPECLTWRLCAWTQSMVSLLICQGAWSQNISNTRFPDWCAFEHVQRKYLMVKSEHGFPATKRNQIFSLICTLSFFQRTSKPKQARALGSGSFFVNTCSTNLVKCPFSFQLCKSGWEKRLHQVSSWKEYAQSAWDSAIFIKRFRRFFSSRNWGRGW